MKKTKQTPVWRDSVALCSSGRARRAGVSPLGAALRTLRSVLCALAALVLAASCAEDVAPAAGPNQRGDVPARLTISLADFGTPLSDGSAEANSPAATTTRSTIDWQGGTTDYNATNGQIEHLDDAYAMIYIRGDNDQVNSKLVQVENNVLKASELSDLYYPAGASSYDIYAIYPLKANGQQYAYAELSGSPTETDRHLCFHLQREAPRFFLGSDLLYAYRTGISASEVGSAQTLTFNHMMTRLHLKLYKSKDFKQVTSVKTGTINRSCQFTVGNAPHNLITEVLSDHATNIQMDADFAASSNEAYYDVFALIPPQTLTAGFELFQITVDGATFTYTLPHDQTFLPGQEYTYSYMLGDGSGQGWDADMLEPLTVQMQAAGTLTLDNSAGSATYYYRTLQPGGTWSTWSRFAAASQALLALSAGTKVQLYGTNDGTNSLTITSDSIHTVYGNAMSLTLSGYNPTSYTNAENISFLLNHSSTAPASGFRELFNGDTGLIYASGLQLPATTLAASCYEQMFKGCTNLTNGPQTLPAKTLASSCYKEMFKYCNNMKGTIHLGATSDLSFGESDGSMYQTFYNAGTSSFTNSTLKCTSADVVTMLNTAENATAVGLKTNGTSAGYTAR